MSPAFKATLETLLTLVIIAGIIWLFHFKIVWLVLGIAILAVIAIGILSGIWYLFYLHNQD